MKRFILRCVIFVLTVAAIGTFSFVPAIFAQGLRRSGRAPDHFGPVSQVPRPFREALFSAAFLYGAERGEDQPSPVRAP